MNLGEQEAIEFSVGIDSTRTKVSIQFEKPLQFFGMSSDDAEALGKALIFASQKIKAEQAGKNT